MMSIPHSLRSKQARSREDKVPQQGLKFRQYPSLVTFTNRHLFGQFGDYKITVGETLGMWFECGWFTDLWWLVSRQMWLGNCAWDPGKCETNAALQLDKCNKRFWIPILTSALNIFQVTGMDHLSLYAIEVRFPADPMISLVLRCAFFLSFAACACIVWIVCVVKRPWISSSS